MHGLASRTEKGVIEKQRKGTAPPAPLRGFEEIQFQDRRGQFHPARPKGKQGHGKLVNFIPDAVDHPGVAFGIAHLLL